MSRIMIVTGPPGAGKTTLSRRAAEAHPRGLHLLSDVFYTFPAHAIPPVRPESHDQNTAVIAAVSRAAAAFAARGYEVFLDGIVGPWFLPVVAEELGPTGIPVDYVILRISLEQALRRAATRSEGGDEAVVRHMHAAFEERGDYRSHVFDATHLTVEEGVAELTRRRAAGAFALDLTRVRAGARPTDAGSC